MADARTRFGFALLCALLMVAIGMGAVWEIVRFRRSAPEEQRSAAATPAVQAARAASQQAAWVSTRQLRLRLLSAVLWMAVLGTLAYAVTALWPLEGRTLQGRAQASRFAWVVIAALGLMLVAFALLVYDVIQVARERRLQTARLHQSLADLARAEAERLRESQRESQHQAQHQPPDGEANGPQASRADSEPDSSSGSAT